MPVTVSVYINSFIKEMTECFVPENIRQKVVLFQRVFVQIGREKFLAIIVHIHEDSLGKNTDSMLKISRIADKNPVLNQEQYELSGRVADHYLSTRGDVLFAMIPSGRREVPNNPDLVPIQIEQPPLNQDQAAIFQKIINSKETNERLNIHLIHGITGSGKTRVYIELIQEYLKKKIGVIFLIPEIALSYQFLEAFKPIFGEQMAILHSGLSRSRRIREYRRVLREEARLVVGTRSSIFAPVKDLGLVILDEEHDASYKEHSLTKYHAKWVAHDRLRHTPSWPFTLPKSIVLGSATPAVDSMYYAKKNIFTLHELKKRATGQSLPVIHIPLHQPADDGADVLSPFLVNKMEEHLKRNNQVILVLNRRGYNNCAFCSSCQSNVMCPNCSVSLTHHRGDTGSENSLKCHLCGYREIFNPKCKECGSKLRLLGKGIQKVEDALDFHFPKAVYARMDQDSVSSKGYAEDIISAMLARKIDILIGTQMITKGFDLPGVTLVGLLNADIGLALPDFRASERVFQLLTQASGRAGRHSGGEVILQTMQPEHYAIAAAAESDYHIFYERELQLRHKMNYPPFCRLLRILFRSKNEDNLWHFVSRLKNHIQDISGVNSLFDQDTNLNMPAEILGPVEAPLYKINNEYRAHLLAKDQSLDRLKDFGKNLRNFYLTQKRKLEDIKAEFDLDPMDVL